ncbi:MAG: ATP synthase subunit beta [candidate division WWE3 bacterium GW2011_GWB2_43_22]|uniref:ATP synthase subunit beta n=1 Tax=candidate division WWE3 bacterium GW2011_GWB2_43_22 TaxID=1619118 RepID=A0A0G1GS02_UNCKA|nr:MAG: ATP synthase subunit beta [candidate division WWE3 bacterium GW2011_GWB2_43_22]
MTVDKTIEGVKNIMDGNYDDVPEDKFMNIGSIDEINTK